LGSLDHPETMLMTRLATWRRRFPTLVVAGAPIRWIGKSRKRICVAVILVLAILATPPLCWLLQLAGLPDIGDPFDVTAFRAFSVPDDQNAFVLYSKAAALLKARPEYQATSGVNDMLALWSTASPELRRCVDDNREALAVYCEGAARPDAVDSNAGLERESFTTLSALWSFRFLAMLKASQLEEQGNMDGAWDLYRANLRTIHHVGMHGDVDRRYMVQHWHRDLRNRLMTWADDKRTTPALLRRAIDDVTACEALAQSEQDSLKAGYLATSALLESPRNPGRQVPLVQFKKFWHPDYQLDPEQIQALWDGWRFFRREPERSQRLIRLITANWLAYLDLPVEIRPKPDPQIASFNFYRFGPQAPAQASILAPETLDRWFHTAHDAPQVLRFFDASGVRSVEQANHVDFLVLLGSELYHRDHGTDPPTPEALVGPYLKSLPSEAFSALPTPPL
jgi:hypothetical protein